MFSKRPRGRILKILRAFLLAGMLAFFLAACAGGNAETGSSGSNEPASGAQAETPAPGTDTDSEEESVSMQLQIGDTAVSVEWESNESVAALQALCEGEPLVIPMSMYGGFEQVGSIGQSLPRNDVQTAAEAGDIVLYSGDQIVVFYGSNSWAYTRLGHITDQTVSEMEDLLGNGDVTITIDGGRTE